MPVTTRSVANSRNNLPPVYVITVKRKPVRYLPINSIFSFETLNTVTSIAATLGTAAGTLLSTYD